MTIVVQSRIISLTKSSNLLSRTLRVEIGITWEGLRSLYWPSSVPKAMHRLFVQRVLYTRNVYHIEIGFTNAEIGVSKNVCCFTLMMDL